MRKCEYCGAKETKEWNKGVLVAVGCANGCMGSTRFYQYGSDDKKIKEYFK